MNETRRIMAQDERNHIREETKQKMIEDEMIFLDKLSEAGYSDYDGDSSLITKRVEELKSKMEKT